MYSAGFGTQIAPKWALPKPCNFITSSRTLGERKDALARNISIREASSPGVTRTSDLIRMGEKKRQVSRHNSGEKFSQAGGQSDPDFHGLKAKEKEPLMNYHLIWSILRILKCPTGDYFLGGTYQTSPKVSGPTESCPKLSLSTRSAVSQTSNLSLWEKYKLKWNPRLTQQGPSKSGRDTQLLMEDEPWWHRGWLSPNMSV